MNKLSDACELISQEVADSGSLCSITESLSRSKLSGPSMRSDPMDTGPLPIMTYGVRVITGGSHAPEEFYPHRPAGPSLRRLHPSGTPQASGPRTEVPRRPAADSAVLRRRPHHLAVGRLQVPA